MNSQLRFHQSTIDNFRKIKSHFPTAIVAGGCIRDSFLGIPVKDMDVFIYIKPHNSVTIQNARNPSHWSHRLNSFWRNVLGDKNWGVRKKDSNGYQPNRYVDSVFEAYNSNYDFNNPRSSPYKKISKIDLIFITKPFDEFFRDEFDFNICKAFYDITPSGTKFTLTSEFLRDVSNKTITLSGPFEMRKIKFSLNVHYQRIKYKFPGYRLDIPYEYQEFIDEGDRNVECLDDDEFEMDDNF